MKKLLLINQILDKFKTSYFISFQCNIKYGVLTKQNKYVIPLTFCPIRATTQLYTVIQVAMNKTKNKLDDDVSQSLTDIYEKYYYSPTQGILKKSHVIKQKAPKHVQFNIPEGDNVKLLTDKSTKTYKSPIISRRTSSLSDVRMAINSSNFWSQKSRPFDIQML